MQSPPKHPGGPKGKLSPEIIDNLSSRIAAGLPVKYACQAEGISEATIYRWLTEAETEPDIERRALLRELQERIKKAEAAAIQRNLKQIESHAPKNWQAAAWLLERKYPGDFGQRIETGPNEPIKVTIELVEPKLKEGVTSVSRQIERTGSYERESKALQG